MQIFVSYQLRTEAGDTGFGDVTYNGREPTTGDEIENIRKGLADAIERERGYRPSIVIMWWKALGE